MLNFALEDAAMAAIRVKGHYLEAQYRRLKPRRGHERALGAVKHTILSAIWHMLATGETYRDLGGDYFIKRDPARQTKRLIKQLERLGHHVTLAEGAAAASANFSCQFPWPRCGPTGTMKRGDNPAVAGDAEPLLWRL